MKKYILLMFVLCAFGFSRTSGKHQIVVSPEYSLGGKSAFGTITAAHWSEDDSLKWKRRHKRRKKTRRPQRGR
tara:strand:- start:34 stop:252 length:219 start_codon:yes stop_codon:yes gene_type:complete